MGMDVYGKDPTSDVGHRFRASVWWWHPLWDYCCAVYEPCNRISGHTNDGEGLNEWHSRKLSARLNKLVENGEAQAYIAIRDAELAALPNKVCNICKGTGRRLEAPNVGPGNVPCNGCKETGSVDDFRKHYKLDLETIKEFAAFLWACGGFEIC